MNPWDEIPRRVRPCDSMRSKRATLISTLCRGLHQGQRSCTAQKGRTYDRTVPTCEIDRKCSCHAGRSTYESKNRCSAASRPRPPPRATPAMLRSEGI